MTCIWVLLVFRSPSADICCVQSATRGTHQISGPRRRCQREHNQLWWWRWRRGRYDCIRYYPAANPNRRTDGGYGQLQNASIHMWVNWTCIDFWLTILTKLFVYVQILWWRWDRIKSRMLECSSMNTKNGPTLIQMLHPSTIYGITLMRAVAVQPAHWAHWHRVCEANMQ